MRLIMQRRGPLLSVDLQERNRQKERMGESESGGGIKKNGVVGLIMYTGQP